MPTQLIDYSTVERQQRGKRSKDTYIVRCAGCGYTRRITRAAALKSERLAACYMCSQKQKAKLGFQAMVNRYGWRWAIPHIKATLDAKPSQPEVLMARLLDKTELVYDTNVIVTTKSSGRKKWSCLVDYWIVFNGNSYALEVDGNFWHSKPECKRRDVRKERLLRRRKVPLLRIDSREVSESAIDRIWALIRESEKQRAEMHFVSA